MISRLRRLNSWVGFGCLLLSCVIALNFKAPAVKADTFYADGNGNGIPDWVEDGVFDACTRPGRRTFWTLWPAPYAITPPLGAVTYGINLNGVAYVCPDAPYAVARDGRFFDITSLSPFVSLSRRDLFVGDILRGRFSAIVGMPATINLTGLPPGCSLHNLEFSVEAFYPARSENRGVTSDIQICFTPPLEPPAVVDISKSIPSGRTVYEPDELVGYVIGLVKRPGGAPVRTFYAGDNVFAPLVYQSAIPLPFASPPSGGQGGVVWGLNAGQRAQLDNSANGGPPVFLTLITRAQNVASRQCFTNVAGGIGDDVYGRPAAVVPGAAPEICVIPPREPYLNTSGGDVHAGGGLGAACTLASNQRGFIRSPTDPGYVSADARGRRNSANTTGSTSQYVLSATGSVSQFGSNNSGGNSLTFGNTPISGRYGTLCRPDLATEYLNYSRYPDGPVSPAGVTFATYGSNSVSPGDALNTNTIYRVNTPLFTISAGQVPKGRNVTFVVEGDVSITGNIGYEGNLNSRSDIPSFGVIATGNIRIDNDVRNLKGVYMSNATINTCWDEAGSPDITVDSTLCDRPLTLAGSLVGNRVRFRRTFGDVNASTAPSEQLSFGSELVISTPPGLANLTAGLRYQGERPPAY